MSTTRRGFLGWVAALFGGAAVAKVAPAEAQKLDALADFERAVRSGPLSKAIRSAADAIEAETEPTLDWAGDGMDAARLQAEMQERSEAFAAAWEKSREEHARRMLEYLGQYGGINSVARGTHDVYPRITVRDGQVEHVKVPRPRKT